MTTHTGGSVSKGIHSFAGSVRPTKLLVSATVLIFGLVCVSQAITHRERPARAAAKTSYCTSNVNIEIAGLFFFSYIERPSGSDTRSECQVGILSTREGEHY